MGNISLRPRIFAGMAMAMIAGMFSSVSHAVPVGVGQTVALPGTTLAAEPNLAGTVLFDNVYSFNQTFGTDVYVGSVQERVVQETGSGTLDFYWRVFNTGTPGIDATLGDFRVGNFNIPSTPVNLNYRTDGLGSVAPGSAERFTGSFANYFNYLFPNGIAPGESSYFLLAETSATNFAQNAGFDLTNVGETQIVYTGVQVSPIPEPATCAVMAVGLGVMWFAIRRRKSS